jgi:hypothetical protein
LCVLIMLGAPATSGVAAPSCSAPSRVASRPGRLRPHRAQSARHPVSLRKIARAAHVLDYSDPRRMDLGIRLHGHRSDLDWRARRQRRSAVGTVRSNALRPSRKGSRTARRPPLRIIRNSEIPKTQRGVIRTVKRSLPRSARRSRALPNLAGPQTKSVQDRSWHSLDSLDLLVHRIDVH